MPYLLIGRPWPRAQHPKNVVLACVHAQHCGPTVRALTIKAAHSRSIGFQINRKEETLMSKRRSSAAIARHALTPKTRSMCAAGILEWNHGERTTDYLQQDDKRVFAIICAFTSAIAPTGSLDRRATLRYHQARNATKSVFAKRRNHSPRSALKALEL